jgi:erythromycin esterase-like protein
MGLTTRRAVDRIATDIGDEGVVGELLAFLRENETARRGLTRFRREVP